MTDDVTPHLSPTATPILADFGEEIPLHSIRHLSEEGLLVVIDDGGGRHCWVSPGSSSAGTQCRITAAAGADPPHPTEPSIKSWVT